MGKIKSNTISAQNAISELVGVDTSDKQNQQVEFSYTTEIAGMEAGRWVKVPSQSRHWQ